MRRNLWLGIAVSVLLLWVAFRGVDAGAFWHATRQVRPGWLAALALAMLVRFGLTAVRWRLLVRPVKAVGLHRLFGVTMIGFMANQLLPARIGELVRAYGLARTESLPMAPVLATLVLERVFDGLSLLLFLVGGSFFLRPEPWMVWSAVLSGILYLGALLSLGSLRDPRTARLAYWLLARLPARIRPRAARLAEAFGGGLEVLGDRRALLAVAGLSLAIWSVNAAGYQASFAAFALDLPLHAAPLVSAVVTLALVLPSAPGFVGPLQAATVAGLALFGVPPAVALALSFVAHVVNATLIVALGLVYLNAYDLSFGALRTVGREASRRPAAPPGSAAGCRPGGDGSASESGGGSPRA